MGDESSTIFTDESVFSQIKEKSRNAYVKSWEDFKTYIAGHNFKECHPGEEDIISFFNHLRNEKKMASSSIWTIYSYINSVMKRKLSMETLVNLSPRRNRSLLIWRRTMICSRMLESPARESLMRVGLASSVW